MDPSNDGVPAGDDQHVGDGHSENTTSLDDSSDQINTAVTGRTSTIATKASAPPQVRLRTLSLSDHYFWKNTHSEHLSQTIGDKKSDGSIKPLPQNEITVMALDEIAATQGAGFLSHLKSRPCWNKTPNAPRAAQRPSLGKLSNLHTVVASSHVHSAQFPSIYFMRYNWPDGSRAAFFGTSHRSRYLLCDGLLNAPQGDISLYAIQYVPEKTYPVYVTSSESLIVLATSSTFYLIKTSTFERLIGKWPRKKMPPKGPDLALRINTTPYNWTDPASNKAEVLDRFRMPNIEALYNAIVRMCSPQDGHETLTPTIAVDQFRQTIPKPYLPERGIALGLPFATDGIKTAESSKSPIKRGRPLSRGRGRLPRGGDGTARNMCVDGRKSEGRIGDGDAIIEPEQKLVLQCY